PKIPDVDENVLTLKLTNGYNVGLKFTPGMQIKKIGSAGKLSQMPKLIVEKKDLPSIAIIATGGTIGTHIDYKTGGVFMSRSPEEILAMAPDLQNFVNLKNLSSPFRTPSEDMSIENWKILAKEVARQANDPEIKGIVITHGTDTLHYTASALSFMLKDLGKPVALVGAQKSPDRGSFDGTLNLICGARFAAYSNCAEVAIVMHGSDSDEFCLAHRGTKARKMHSTRRDAFRSVNDSPLAKIFADGKIEMLNDNYKKRNENTTIADSLMENNIAILKIYPGSDPKLLGFLVSSGCKGVVLEATGLGHVPTGLGGTDAGVFDKKFNWIPAIQAANESGIVVAITTQTIYGRVSPTVYRNLRLLFDAGAVFCEDMLTETAYVKLGWVLAHSKNFEDAKKMLLTNIAGELNNRLTEKDILE
ncbi:MAG: Glu-tRNA(Gln) amidotransferase subunit GatD, partial [Candidatus Micrarchaeota archaeon]